MKKDTINLLNPQGSNIRSFPYAIRLFSFASSVIIATIYVVYIASGANTTIGNNISTSGNLTIGGTAQLSGILNASSTLQVTGATRLYNTLTVDSSVGIGTTSPSKTLSVQGNALISGDVTLANLIATGTATLNNITLTGSCVGCGGGSGNVGASTAAGQVPFYSDSATTTLTATSTVTISSGGRVGIGTTSPAAFFSVGGNGYFTGSVGIGTANPQARLHITGASAGGANIAGTNPGYALNGTSVAVFGLETSGGTWSSDAAANDVILRSSSGKVLLQSGTGASALVVTTGNLVGVGTTSPSQTLAVQGSALFSGNLSLANITATGTLSLTGTTGTSTIASGQGFTVGTSQFIVQQGSGKVGIGTVDPVEALDVSGNLNVSTNIGVGSSANQGDVHIRKVVPAGDVRIFVENASNLAGANAKALIQVGGSGANDPMVNFSVSGVSDWSAGIDNSDLDKFKISESTDLGTNEWFTILSGGNVGIGTTSPSKKLSVQGNTLISGDLTVANLTATGTVFLGSLGTTSVNNLSVTNTSTSTFAGPISNTSGNLTIASTGTTNKLLLNPYGGNVGIGTDDPLEKLSVKGNLKFFHPSDGNGITRGINITPSQSGGAGSILSYINTSGSFDFGAINAGSGIQSVFMRIISQNTATPENSAIALYTNTSGSSGVERMRVNGDGAVGIGTTSPSQTLAVQGNALFSGNISSVANITATGTLTITGTQSSLLTLNNDSITVLDIPSSTTGLVTAGQRWQFKPNAGGLALIADSNSSDPNGIIARFKYDNDALLVYGNKINATGDAIIDGSIGVSTTSPSQKLSVQGSALLSGNLSLANLTATGTIGVGTSTPAESLATAGRLYVGGTGTSTIENNFLVRGNLQIGSDSTLITSSSVRSQTFQATPGAGNSVTVTSNRGSGASSTSGSVTIAGADAAIQGSANGGSVNITGGGSSGAVGGTSGTGGSINLTSGSGANGTGGNIALATGGGTSAGNITLTSGNGTAGGGTGGSITLTAGTSGGFGASAGNITIQGGAGSGTGPSGNLTLAAGSGGSSNGYIAFQTGGSEQGRITGSGFLGIGTSSPTQPISVQGNALFSGNISSVANINATGTLTVGGMGTSTFAGPIAASSNNFVIQAGTDAAHTLHLDPYGGRVGIRNPSSFSNNEFVVNGDAGLGSLCIISGGGCTASSGFLLDVTQFGGTASAIIQNTSNSSNASLTLRSRTTSNQDWTFTSTGSDSTGDLAVSGPSGNVMRLTSSGNVGIGTTSPSQTLAVQGNALFSGNLNLANLTATGSLTLSGTSGTSTIASGQGFTIGGTQFVVQQGSGGVGIGTTSPDNLLTVIGQTAASGRIKVATSSSVGSLTIGDIGHYDNTVSADFSPFFNGAVASASDMTVFNSSIHSTADTGTVPAVVLSARGHSSGFSGAQAIANRPLLGVANFNSIKFLIDKDGNVGVGTTSPNWNLQVAGTRPFMALSDTGAGTNLKHWTLSSQGGNFYVATSSDALATSTSESVFTILSNGRVGIGNTNPVGKLDISTARGETGTNLVLARYSTSANDRPVLSLRRSYSDTFGTQVAMPAEKIGELRFAASDGTAFRDSIEVWGEAEKTFSTGDTPASLVFQTRPAGVGFERMRLTSDGRFGVGTSSPGGWLSVSAATVTPAFLLNQTSTGDLLTLQDSGSTVFTVKDGGNVGIGTSTPGNLNADFNNLVISDSAGSGGITINTPSSATGNLSFNDTGDTSSQGLIRYEHALDAMSLWTSGVQRITVNSSGSVGIGTTSPSAKLSLTGSGTGTGRNLVIADSDNTEKITILDNGRVGIGEKNPNTALYVIADVAAGTALTLSDNTNATMRFSFPSSNVAAIASNEGAHSLAFGGQSSPGGAFTERFRINNVTGNSYFSSGNVGIGTTNPLSKLHVASTSNTTFGNSRFLMLDSTNASLGGLTEIGLGVRSSSNYQPVTIGSVITDDSGQSSADFYIATRSGNGDTLPSERLRVTGSGNVGIGTTSPGTLLSLHSGSDFINFGVTSTSTFSKGINLTSGCFAINGTCISGGGGGSNGWVDDGTVVRLETDTDKVGIGTTSPSQALSVQGNALFSGNLNLAGLRATGTVGIGTASPLVELHIRGVSDSRIMLESIAPGARQWQLSADSTTGGAGNVAGQFRIYDETASRARFVIDTAGRIGLGTSTPRWNVQIASSSPVFLALSDLSASTGLKHWTMSSQGGNFYIATSSDALATSTLPALTILSNGNVGIGTTSPTYKFSVTGTVGFDGLTSVGVTEDALCLSVNKEVQVNTGSATCTLSSKRFKHDIQDSDAGLSLVLQLRPVSFTNNGTEEERLGLIAEEVYEVEPRLVVKELDGSPRGVRYEELTSVLVKAIQEQQEQIAQITSEYMSSLVGSVKAWLESMKVYVEDGLVRLRGLVAENLTATVANILDLKVGTPENPTGVTIYDKTTKQPYCLVMDNGQLQSIPGQCPSGTTNNSNSDNASSTPDTTPPTITMNGPSTIELEKGTQWSDPGATVTDDTNPNIGLTYMVNNTPTSNEGRDLPTIDTNLPGTYTITYIAQDEAGNTSQSERTVIVREVAVTTEEEGGE